MKLLGAIDRVLELGCASGPNLELFAREFPKTQFVGLDISSSAINLAKESFKVKGLGNVSFIQSDLSDLKRFEDNYFDVVVSVAVLIYFDPKQMKNLAKELDRITRKMIILLEYDHEGEGAGENQLGGYWIRDYKLFFPKARVSKFFIDDSIWAGNWVEYGKLVCIEY